MDTLIINKDFLIISSIIVIIFLGTYSLKANGLIKELKEVPKTPRIIATLFILCGICFTLFTACMHSKLMVEFGVYPKSLFGYFTSGCMVVIPLGLVMIINTYLEYKTRFIYAIWRFIINLIVILLAFIASIISLFFLAIILTPLFK